MPDTDPRMNKEPSLFDILNEDDTDDNNGNDANDTKLAAKKVGLIMQGTGPQVCQALVITPS